MMGRYIKDQVELHGGNPEPIEGYAEEENNCEICKKYLKVRDVTVDDHEYDYLCEYHKKAVDDYGKAVT